MRLSSHAAPALATAVIALGLYLAGCAMYPHFASARVLVNLLGDNAFLGVAAVGGALVILSGGIDLSVGAVVALSSTLVAALVGAGAPPAAAIGAALGAGALLGAANGGLIVAFRLPPFLVTLAAMFFARGMAFVVHPRSLGIRHPFFVSTIHEALGVPLGGGLVLPLTASVFLATLGAGVLLAHGTRLGRWVYAVGGDEQSAALMGVPVGRTRIAVYAIAGLCSALAGVVYTFYTQSGDPACCVGFELDVIAAVVIGGTLLTGGVGTVAGSALGTLVLGLIQTLITFQGTLSSWWTRIAVGVLLLVFISLQHAAAGLGRRG